MIFMQEILGGAGGAPATISYRTNRVSTTDASSYTFSATDIGTDCDL